MRKRPLFLRLDVTLSAMKKLLTAVVVLGCLLMVVRVVGPSILDRSQNHTLNSGPYLVSAEAAALHRTLLVADLHADTLLWGRDILAASHEGHIDLPRLIDGNVGIQGFTVFSTVPRGINIERNEDTTDLVRYIGVLQGWPLKTIGSPKQVALYQANRLQKFVDQSNGSLILLRTRGDLEKFRGSGKPDRTWSQPYSARKEPSHSKAIFGTSMSFTPPVFA